MSAIFINYRKADMPWADKLLDEVLSERFGRTKIFRATRSIVPGDEFDPVIIKNLCQAKVVLAMIGPNWTATTDSLGRRRLEDPADWVRRELLTAQEHRIPVIPVLDRDNRLHTAELPAELHWLAGLQSVRIRSTSWDIDKRALFDAIERAAPSLGRASVPPQPLPSRPAPEEPWATGTEIASGQRAFLLHRVFWKVTGRDESWVWRDADADQVEPELTAVVLRQLRVRRGSTDARRWQDGLGREADLLGDPHCPAPRLLDVTHEPETVTVVLARPHSQTLADLYPVSRPLDPWRAAGFLTHLALCAQALRWLHSRGCAHRALSLATFLLPPDGRQVLLRDVGRATLPWSPEEGSPHYRAPEQYYLPSGDADQRRVDVYQLGALAFHVLTGHPPPIHADPPLVSHVTTGLSDFVDRPLWYALRKDPAQRQGSVRELADQLATAAERFRRIGQRS
ncbi:TIR domain-containing protein [Crossiella sp. NPDC003009]